MKSPETITMNQILQPNKRDANIERFAIQTHIKRSIPTKNCLLFFLCVLLYIASYTQQPRINWFMCIHYLIYNVLQNHMASLPPMCYAIAIRYQTMWKHQKLNLLCSGATNSHPISNLGDTHIVCMWMFSARQFAPDTDSAKFAVRFM